jgi:hypothetical protein
MTTPASSAYGNWTSRFGLPAFAYSADQDSIGEAEWDPILSPPTRRHWVMLGNKSIQLQAANDGTVALSDERHGQRWLTAPDVAGTGLSLVEQQDGAVWGSDWENRPPGEIPLRTFGPTWFEISTSHQDISLDRMIVCPDSDEPWLLVRVELHNGSPKARRITHVEQWAVNPGFVNLTSQPDRRASDAEKAVAYDVETNASQLVAHERRTPEATELERGPLPQIFGPPVDIVLEALGETEATARSNQASHPTLELVTDFELGAGERTILWFRFGANERSPTSSPDAILEQTLRSLEQRLPRAAAAHAEEAAREIPWHTALLSGGACRDEVIGEHTLNQASAYSYSMGFNGAARDPLQHALPLVYIDPLLALSVLRNTCSWSAPDGDLPYALDGAKHPWTQVFQPSDQNLWALWLAAEYAAATGDLESFREPLPYHPDWKTEPVSLVENLRRQFDFFVNGVGRGEHGHVRMRNADWNDAAITLSGIDREVMIERGESILNSAFAGWVLPVYAGLCDRLGDEDTGDQARTLAGELVAAVARDWNGRWFRRAYAPGKGALGDDDCWLEVQPWAILCGAASPDQSIELLKTLDDLLRTDSPLGARVRWPLPDQGDFTGLPGEGFAGSIWFSINMTLAWAAARHAPELAWDELRRMSLSAHTAAYPSIWEGTLSGPDAYNAPGSPRPGRTWGTPQLAMQHFPVNNLHSHSQPILSYLRLLGVEPTAEGTLQVGGGGSFESPTFRIAEDGHGWLESRGEVQVTSKHGNRSGARGRLEW